MISRKTTISAAALLLASAGAAAAFPATATTDLNLRSGPGTGYSVVDQLQAGDTVEVVSTRGSWYQTAEGGWASGNYLEASGGQSTYIESGGYGPVAFYYDDSPYYYDNAGFYFYIDGGRRHRVDHGWFRGRDHNNFRWSNAKHRHHFEQRIGQNGGGKNWGGNNNGGKNWDGDRNASNSGDNNRPQGGKNWNGGGNAGASVNNDGVSAGGEVQVGRSATEGYDGPRQGGGNGPRMGGPGRGGDGGGRGGDGAGRGGGGGQGGGGQWQPRGQ